jgi:hypothetical protein
MDAKFWSELMEEGYKGEDGVDGKMMTILKM